MNAERFFTRLANGTDAGPTERAPAHLKARIYSALVLAQAADNALRSLPATKAAGRPLCPYCGRPLDPEQGLCACYN